MPAFATPFGIGEQRTRQWVMVDVSAQPLTAAELRVLGCLIEKEATTPDNYPLTLNSLRLACNQSTSRDPVVDYDEHTVEEALASLRERGITRTVHSTSNRAAKYRHVANEYFDVDPAQLAVLDVLMLRGPQTVGEIKGRTERQYGFDSVEAVVDTLDRLQRFTPPLVERLERQPGQKDARWVHRLGEAALPVGASPQANAESPTTSAPDGATHEFDVAFAATGGEGRVDDLLSALQHVDVDGGTVVDLSAGVGTSLGQLYELLPDAEVVAVEPSSAKRAVLLSRLRAASWSATVDPRPIGEAALPRSTPFVIALDVLPGASPAVADALWGYLTVSLARGGAAVIGVAPAAVKARVEVAGLDVERVGDEYLVRRVGHPDEVIARLTAPPIPSAVEPDAVIATARTHGLVAEAGTCCVIIRSPMTQPSPYS